MGGPPEQQQQQQQQPAISMPLPLAPGLRDPGEDSARPPQPPPLPQQWQMQMSAGMLGFPNLMFAPNLGSASHNLSTASHSQAGGLRAGISPTPQEDQGLQALPSQQLPFSMTGRAPEAQSPP